MSETAVGFFRDDFCETGHFRSETNIVTADPDKRRSFRRTKATTVSAASADTSVRVIHPSVGTNSG